METQTKQVLSFSEILQHFLGKEVYICTTQNYNGPMVVKGFLTYFDEKNVILDETHKSYTVTHNCIDSICLVNHNVDFANIETDAPSDFNNPFYACLNRHVECQSSWWRSGRLTYVGTDYVTIIIDDDLYHSYLPVKQISEMVAR